MGFKGSTPKVFGVITALHTSLKSSSLLCCFLRSIFFTATCLPLCFSLAMHTIPVEPSPILIKLSRYSRGSPVGKHKSSILMPHEKTCTKDVYVFSVTFYFPFLTWVDHQLKCSSELLMRDPGGLSVGAGPPGWRRVGPRGDVR